MKDNLIQAWQKVKTFFQNLSIKVRILLIAVLVVILAGVGVAVWAMNSQPYTVLFTGLTSEDMSSVLSYLDENGVVDYQVKQNDTIMVPESQEAALKAKLLMQGYPSSGFGYSMYLDNVNALSTESDRKTLYLMDLQERLGAVVKCFDGVSDAKVTIAQGEDRRYVLDSGNVMEASASVLVTMKNGDELSKEQAEAVRSLIARAVQGLEISNITISDTMGKTYAIEDGEVDTSDASQLKLSLEAQVNNTVRNNVMQVLTPLFGQENVSVSVNSTVDVSRSRGETVTYTEPEWAADGSTGGKGIIGSRVYDHTIGRDENTTTGGVVGTETNADLTTYVENNAQPNGQENQIHVSGEEKFNVDTKTEQTERSAGTLTDLMVSVSINSNAAGQVGTDSLVRHVARAAGIDTQMENDKISILAVPFYGDQDTSGQTTDASGLPPWVLYALIAGLSLFLLLMIVILVIRGRRKKKKLALEQLELQQQQAALALAPDILPPEGMGADIMEIRTERSMELRKDVRSFAENNPEIAAQMVRTWLKGEEEGRGR